MLAKATQDHKPVKTMLVVDMLDQVKSVYIHDDESSHQIEDLLSSTSDILSGCHAALMGELVIHSNK